MADQLILIGGTEFYITMGVIKCSSVLFNHKIVCKLIY